MHLACSNRIAIIIFLATLAGCRTMGGFGGAGLGTGIGVAGVTSHQSENGGEIKIPSKYDTELDLNIGSYFHRQGVLEQMGDSAPTIGAGLSWFDKGETDKRQSGGGPFILWSMDHFLRPTSTLLKPKFWNETYTNYLLGGGYYHRFFPLEKVQLVYQIGAALNFIEIDTFRSNSSAEDIEYTDQNFSVIHKLGLDYIVPTLPGEYGELTFFKIGGSVFYYWTPDPLGKFINESLKQKNMSGSWSWLINFKLEFE